MIAFNNEQIDPGKGEEQGREGECTAVSISQQRHYIKLKKQDRKKSRVYLKLYASKILYTHRFNLYSILDQVYICNALSLM